MMIFDNGPDWRRPAFWPTDWEVWRPWIAEVACGVACGCVVLLSVWLLAMSP